MSKKNCNLYQVKTHYNSSNVTSVKTECEDMASKISLSPYSGFRCCPFQGGCSVVVDSFIMFVLGVFGPCFVMQY